MRYTFLLYLYLTTNSIYNSYPIGRFTLVHIPYSGKLLREKTFANFAVLCFLRKIWGCGTLVLQNRVFHHFAKVFSFESFPLYHNLLANCSTSLHPQLVSAQEYQVCVQVLIADLLENTKTHSPEFEKMKYTVPLYL